MPSNTPLVATISALLTTLVTVPATYLLNDYLARDRISLESVELVPELTQFKPDPEKLEKLSRDTGGPIPSEFYVWMQAQPESTLELFKNRQGNPDDSHRLALADALADFAGYADVRLEKIKELKAAWDSIDWDKVSTGEEDSVNHAYELSSKLQGQRAIDYGNPPRIVESLPYANSLKPAPWAHKPPTAAEAASEDQRTHKEIDDQVNKKIQELEDTKRLATELEAAARDFTGMRTGGLYVHVTFLNAGNTDGLIKAEGSLVIPDRSETLPTVQFDGKVQKVEKRSVSEAWYAINDSAASKSAADDLHQMVKAGAAVTGVAQFNDFRGGVIRSAKVPFPLPLVSPSQ